MTLPPFTMARKQGIVGRPISIMIGIIDAAIGGFLFGYSTINQNVLNLTSLLFSFISTVVLIGIVKLVRHAFRGRDQVRTNWSIVFRDVPDFQADMRRVCAAGDTVWTEWHWR